jgi:RNA polymerase sigma-70 factor, ECF subfamily
LIDEELIERVRSKEKTAFRSLYTLCSQRVYKTAYMILKDKEYAEDVVQETFIQVYLKIGALTNVSAFNVWLYKITVNNCYRLIKRNKKSGALFVEDDIDRLTEFQEGESELPENIFIQKENIKAIMECIYTLPVNQRTTLILFYFNDMSIKQISEIMKCSEGTVKSRMFHGRRALKAVIQNACRPGEENSVGGVICEI